MAICCFGMKFWDGVRERGVVRQMYVRLGVMVLRKSSKLLWGLEKIIVLWSCEDILNLSGDLCDGSWVSTDKYVIDKEEEKGGAHCILNFPKDSSEDTMETQKKIVPRRIKRERERESLLFSFWLVIRTDHQPKTN